MRSIARPLVVGAFAVGGGACQDAFTAPVAAPTPVAPNADAAPAQALACSVDVRARTLACASLPSTAGPVPRDTATRDASGPRRALVIGRQGVYVRLYGSPATPTSPSSDILTVPVAVQNLLAQPLGTTDGVSYDGRGVLVFFSEAPSVTGGTGSVSVVNADSTGTFTASGQEAFVYPQFLAGNQSTPERDWQFRVPSSVTGFTFKVLVRAQLHDESSPLSAQPARVFAASANAGIVGGVVSTCALRIGAGVYCWGTTSFGGVQDSVSAVPLLVPGSGDAVALGTSVDAVHACWITAAGSASCVGNNDDGQFGDSSTNATQIARSVRMPSGVTFTQLALGALHTCGLSSAGNAYCWGYGQTGQLGDGSINGRSIAAAVRMPAGTHFTAIGAGPMHSCGLTAVGAAYCWGINAAGQLGTASGSVQDSVPQPVQMPGAGVAFTQIAGGATFTCALASSGAAYCWGGNRVGQLGDSTVTDHPTPEPVRLPSGVTLSQIAVGDEHACGRATDGRAFCWGGNGAGQLGDSSLVARARPVAVRLPAGVTFAQLSAGGTHTCGLTAAGAAYCWGDNEYAQIGDGTRGLSLFRVTPVAVHMP